MSESLITQFPEMSLTCDECLTEPPPQSSPQLWSPHRSDYLRNLYAPDAFYYPDLSAFTRQKEITERMRSILLDWLMALCSEFYLKRETYYLALSHIDRLLSSILIPRSQFQLIGITALFLACKSEEINPPTISDFTKAYHLVCPASSIIVMETKILQVLRWRILPVTLYGLLNNLLVEWDRFIASAFSEYLGYVESLTRDKIKQQDLMNKRLETFKRENTYSYRRFRDIVQILDACTLEYEVHNFENLKLIGALLYLVVNRCFYQSKYELLWWNSLVLGDSDFLGEEEIMLIGTEAVHGLLERFLCSAMNITSLEGLTPALQYLNKFLGFTFCYKLPPVSKISRNIQENYESFLSFQTHNENNLQFLAISKDKINI